MTRTDKPVQRVTCAEYHLPGAGLGRDSRLVVKVGPGDSLNFRLFRCRQWAELPIGEAFNVAIRRAAKLAQANHVPHELDDR